MSRQLSQVIHSHILPWRSMEWPVDWDGVFGRSAPLVLEIGFGAGEFLEEQALAHPARNHVGLELSWTSASHLLRRLEKRAITNVRVLLAAADVALDHLFTPASLAEVFVNHPCPWPKARHGDRRLIRPDFVALLADRMAPGARLTLVTDHADYAAWSTEVLEGQRALESCHATTEVATIPGRTPTRYQKKAMAQGIPIHFFEWRKVRPPDSLRPSPPVDPLDAMPSLTLSDRHAGSGEHPPLLADFASSTHVSTLQGVETVVRFVAAYAALADSSWLVETLVVEGRLRQEFGIQLIRHPQGDVLVKLSSLARPHPTHGVKLALWRMGQWLLEHHAGLELKHENVGREVAGHPASEGGAEEVED